MRVCVLNGLPRVLLLLITGLINTTVRAETPNDDCDQTPLHSLLPEHRSGIHLTLEAQRHSGIVTQRLPAIQRQAESSGYGTVIDLQPLLTLRSRYQAIQTQQTIRAAALETSRHSYQRLQQLHQASIIPTRKLQQAKAQWQTDQARLQAGDEQLRTIRDSSRQRWGNALTHWALSHKANAFQRLLNRQSVLILVTLPAQQTLPQDTSVLYVAQNPDRRHAHQASLISAAPQTHPFSQGETYYAHTRADRLRTGMQVHVWVPQSDRSTTGVELPVSAVVWHSGKPWVYTQDDHEWFSRRPVTDYQLSDKGYFVDAVGFRNRPLVTTGGQLLLSEEFRWQIPEESDDDD